MMIRLLCFAQLRDQLQSDEHAVTLPAAATGCHVRDWCAQRAAVLQPLLDVSRLAVNQEYVSWEHALHDGDEVAIIPPVSGG